MKVLVTGASGYIGSLVTNALSGQDAVTQLIAVDVRPFPGNRHHPDKVKECLADVRSDSTAELILSERPDVVCHLASIVTPGRESTREFEYSVDVLGTRNVLDACIKGGVSKIVVSSSGAAYGYHADSPAELVETAPLRGNPEFAYSDHKRIVEELLEDYRSRHPHLKQLILRLSTVLGATVKNQITSLFDKPVMFGISGAGTPFTFIWDRDLVEVFVRGCIQPVDGIYNVTGDGVLTLSEIAKIQGKPYLSIPAPLLAAALVALKTLGLTRYGPEQVGFLRFRPVLSNRKLRTLFPDLPSKSTRDAFHEYLNGRSNR
jgi:UDP-glucose 4-epimerase